MMGALIPFALRLGVPQRFARAAVIAALVVIAALAAVAVKKGYDTRLIGQHDNAVAATVTKRARTADNGAAVQRRADDARANTEATQIEKVIHDAPSTPVSDARRRYYECVRLQQAARAARNPAPACE